MNTLKRIAYDQDNAKTDYDYERARRNYARWAALPRTAFQERLQELGACLRGLEDVGSMDLDEWYNTSYEEKDLDLDWLLDQLDLDYRNSFDDLLEALWP